MKFHFEYKPVAFKKYVNETFTKVNLLPYPDYDKEAFKNMLISGIGRGKAYGMGLMTVVFGN